MTSGRTRRRNSSRGCAVLSDREALLPDAAGVRRTEREKQTLRLLIEGLVNKEIAARHRISESAVKATLQMLLNKTGVRTRSQLVRIALERFRDEI